ncbi:MAG: RseA family anti-sigma factor [Actinomycetota bacterium]
MTLDDRFSAWLDGELDDNEIADLETALAADTELAAEFEALRSVRDLIRSEAVMAMPAAAYDRVVEAVSSVDVEDIGPDHAAGVTTAAPDAAVIDLATRRRRVPTFAAVAASFAIIVSVVGGLGGSTTLPAVGDLIARHDAAAAEMPASEGGPMDDMPEMPAPMEMAMSDTDDDVVHAVYVTPGGAVVSVFRQDGELDVNELVDEMNGGETGDMAGHPMWAKDIGDLHVTVVDGDGYVWTFINDVDEPVDMMDDMVNDLPARSAGIRERLHDVAEAIVEPFGFGF